MDASKVALLKDILLKIGIKHNVSEVSSRQGAAGDGAIGLTKAVTVTFEDTTIAPLELFLKMHTGNPAHEAFLADMRVFERESSFFMDYLPEAKRLCSEKGLPDLVDIYPHCYFADADIVVLENLVPKGFQLIPHEERHDFRTASVALKTLAKQHAVSHAVFKASGGIDSFVTKFPELGNPINAKGFISVFNSSIQKSLDGCIKILQKQVIPGQEEALATLNKNVGTSLLGMLQESIGSSTNAAPIVVLSHGDYKNDNMMFIRDPTTKEVEHHVAVDLQGARCNSPGYDLSFYLFTSVDHAVRQTQLNELLSVYIKCLNEISSQLGVPTNLEFDHIMTCYREKFYFGFWVALMLIGPGMNLMRTLDNEETDFSDYFNVYHKLLLKWIDGNTDAGKTLANEIIGLVKEYNKLKL